MGLISTLLLSTERPNGGLDVPTTTRTIWNRSGATLAAGDVFMFDQAKSQAESVSVRPEDEGGTTIWSNVINPTAAGAELFRMGVAMESIADNARGKGLMFGLFDTFVIKGSGSIAIGDPLWADTAKNASANAAAAGVKFIGLANAAVTTPATRVRASVFFDGSGHGVEGGT